MPLKTKVIALAALAVALTGGIAMAERAAIGDGSATLPGTSWSLVAVDGEAIQEGVEATLNFGAEEDSIGGNGGCNSFGGSIAYEDGAIDISEVFSTMMACEEPKMSTERGFFNALERAETYQIEGATLTLLDQTGAVAVLVAAETDVSQASGSVAVPSELAGTEWRAVSLGGERAAAGVETTLTFNEDGTAGGHTGCNDYHGPVGFGADGSVELGMMTATERGCFDPAGSQERALFEALDQVAGYRVANTRLTLTDTSGTVVAEFEPAR